MKTFTKPLPRFLHREYFAVPHNPKLIAQWQPGFEAISGQTAWKLHLTLAHSPSPAFATVNHCKQV
jgi:hypothetical protein